MGTKTFLRLGVISILLSTKPLGCNSQQAISNVAHDRNDAIDKQVRVPELNVAPRLRQLQSNYFTK
jgi:hypothetical protein